MAGIFYIYNFDGFPVVNNAKFEPTHAWVELLAMSWWQGHCQRGVGGPGPVLFISGGVWRYMERNELKIALTTPPPSCTNLKPSLLASEALVQSAFSKKLHP